MIFQCILGLQSQSIDFKNSFAQADIPSGETVFIEIPRDFKSDGGQHDDVLKLKKIQNCTPVVQKVEIFFVRARFCDEQGGSLPVHF